MTRPLIGITSGELNNAKHPWAPYVFGQSHTYVEAVNIAGGLPIILPILADESMVDQYVEILDGILFSGGNDIGPRRYGQEINGAEEISEARDNFELILMQRFLKTNKPILAICRGHQLLNVFMGGTLFQDLKHSNREVLKHRQDFYPDMPVNKVKIVDKDNILAELYGTEIFTNSFHHQAVNNLGKNLTIITILVLNNFQNNNLNHTYIDFLHKFLVFYF